MKLVQRKGAKNTDENMGFEKKNINKFLRNLIFTKPLINAFIISSLSVLVRDKLT